MSVLQVRWDRAKCVLDEAGGFAYVVRHVMYSKYAPANFLSSLCRVWSAFLPPIRGCLVWVLASLGRGY